jgi:hypothetical protein
MYWPISGLLPNNLNIPTDLVEWMMMRVSFRCCDSEEAWGPERRLCRSG